MFFPQLQTITSYSLLSSTIRIPELVQRAKKLNYQALAITDKNVLHGSIEFFEQCQQAKIKPIFGLTLEYNIPALNQTAEILLFAKDYIGYQNLMQLSSIKMTEEESFQSIEKNKALFSNLFGIVPVENGEIKLMLDQFNEQKAEQSLQLLVSLFEPASLFMGISLSHNVNTHRELFGFYQQHKLSLAAIQKVSYLHAEDAFALETLTCIKTNKQLDLKNYQYPKNGDDYLRKEDVAREEFLILQAEEAILNAEKIARTCSVELPLHQQLLPHYPISTDKNAKMLLEEICWEKISQRIDLVTEEYKERLKKELSIIHQLNFDDYFLIIWDVLSFAHKRGIITGAGRGSAAGSLVAYVLSITEVDPIKYHLLFERFLNPERYSMPDIDIDLPDNQREEVLQYINKKYGRHHMVQIATFGTMAAKMVLKDVARVFGFSPKEAAYWTAAVPNTLKMTLDRAYKESEKLTTLIHKNKINQLLFQTAKQLEGLPRHVSTHAAGIIISDQNLLKLIPLQMGSNGVLLTQYTMTDVEKIGLLKMDFLGLKNLSIISNIITIIKRVYHKTIQLNQIPLDDRKTLKLFQEGETSGIFQFESAGIRNVLKKIQPSSIEEIAAINALYRPGPMQNIELFVRRKKGQEPIHYLDPSLELILKNTYGIIVYQEQIIQIASTMAGFSLGQADILRRAISKKKKEMLDKEREHFVHGSIRQGYTKQLANDVYNYIEQFANYGFNRSHAFAYSFIGVQMAYLKVHFPDAFFTALLYSVSHNPIKMKEYIGEAKKNKVKILPPSINKSYANFSLQNQKEIVFGLNAIKGIRRELIQNIVEERQKNGVFTSFDEFLFRIDRKWLKAEVLRPLVVTGVFDEIASNRKKIANDLAERIQSVLFSDGNIELFHTLKIKEEEIEDYTLEERLELEESYLGIYLSGHPTEQFSQLYLRKSIQFINDILENQKTQLLIYIKDVRNIRTKRGEQMAFIEGSDMTGEISLTLFPKIYRQLRQNIEKGKVYYIEGKVERSSYNQELQIIVNKLEEAAKLEKQFAALTTCFLKITNEQDTEETFRQIQTIIQQHSGQIPIIIYFEANGQTIMMNKENQIDESPETKKALFSLLGVNNVIFK
nr:DNA polymerase III subunit alpha [Melissococcus plutonius]